MPALPELLPIVRTVLGAVLGWLLNKTSTPDLSGLTGAINMVWQALSSITGSFVQIRQYDQGAMRTAGTDIDQIGGAVESIGRNQKALWHHMRWIMMPNTITAIYAFVWRAWIRPLRSHIGFLIRWLTDWHGWLQYWLLRSLQWSHLIVASGRAHRARFVYPQLQWLMSPQRVAYWYVQSFLTEISQYLSYRQHEQDRDAIARAVIDQSPRLWRHVEQAMLLFLEHPMDGSGYGSPLPERPPWATQPPPEVPPQWEPWITTPDINFWPPDKPGLPEQHPSYDGGIIGTD